VLGFICWVSIRRIRSSDSETHQRARSGEVRVARYVVNCRRQVRRHRTFEQRWRGDERSGGYKRCSDVDGYDEVEVQRYWYHPLRWTMVEEVEGGRVQVLRAVVWLAAKRGRSPSEKPK